MGDKQQNFELLYYYEQLENNSTIAFRVPQQLKEDFSKLVGNKSSRILREFLVNYIAERQKKKD